MVARREIGHAVVTGAGGFIGSHLVEKLVALGYEVTALVRAHAAQGIGNLDLLPAEARTRIQIRMVDLLDQNDLIACFESAQTVFHLAAQISVPYSFQAPALFLHTNVLGTYNVLNAAVARGIPRVVVVSSSEVYGGSDDAVLCEDHPLCARSPYAASKIAAEKIAEAYHYTYELGTVIVRPFNTFGPRQSERAVIPRIIKLALAGEEIALGNLTPIRDFVFVSDTVGGLIAAAGATDVEGRTFNLATGAGVSVEQVLMHVECLLGQRLRVRQSDALTRGQRREVWRLVGDATRAGQELGWSSKVSFSAGLERVLEAMRAKSIVEERCSHAIEAG